MTQMQKNAKTQKMQKTQKRLHKSGVFTKLKEQETRILNQISFKPVQHLKMTV